MPLSCKGDNDPLDLVELGNDSLELGEICTVKVLGCIAMIDEGEIDWKVLAIRTSDPLAQVWNNIEDVDAEKLESVFHWFQYYKTTDGKPENTFGLNRRPGNVEYTYNIIRECHESWKKLMEKGSSKLWSKE